MTLPKKKSMVSLGAMFGILASIAIIITAIQPACHAIAVVAAPWYSFPSEVNNQLKDLQKKADEANARLTKIEKQINRLQLSTDFYMSTNVITYGH